MDSWIEKDLKYNWHPYTQMKDCQVSPPILIEKAKGIMLYDDRGGSYYDTISSWWCNVHGHNHPKIKKAVNKQLDSLEHVLFAGFTHKPAIMLAESLVSLAPKNLAKVFFSDNGSTAVEIALKMSFQYWQNIGKTGKTKFISLDYGYHGDTIGTMSVSEIALFNEVFKPLFFPSIKIPSPYCYRCPMGKARSSCDIDCVKPLEETLKQKHLEISAMILEPLVMCAGGVIVYPEEYLVKARQITKKYNVHMIADEVATGFGRTGRMFACESARVEPDFMCLSKGITSGYLPLGAVLTTDEVYCAFYADYSEKKTFYHGHTYTANPVACAAAIACLEVFKEEDTLENIKDKIALLHSRLEGMRNCKYVGDVRCIGMIGAVELVKDKAVKQEFSFEERIGFQVYKKGLEQKLILRPLGNVVYLFPPLCITKHELNEVLDRFYKVIELLFT